MMQTIPVPTQFFDQSGADSRLKPAGPCTMVILGASGDLTKRKLIPALFHLMGDGLLSTDFTIIGVGQTGMSSEQFRDTLYASSNDAAGGQPSGTADAWHDFAARIHYISGDLDDESTYAAIKRHIAAQQQLRVDSVSEAGLLFYFALPPSVYPTTLAHLAESGLAPRTDAGSRPWVRIIIEKPFGRDLQSAQDLNRIICANFAEDQIFRMDHYLGKDTVQNLLVFRFANSIFEPVWNRDHIHHVQITAAESVGVGHRGAYYEETGVIRDMFQNHLLQLMALIAIEPPATFAATGLRSEKTKILSAIRPVDIRKHTVRGQYRAGTIAGKPVRGYRAEAGVAHDSTTPTFAALRLLIDNWRWQGVPFFLRSGKRMPRRLTEIAIQFRKPPHLMFQLEDRSLPANTLVFRIQPDEGISLSLEAKSPGVDLRFTTAELNFSYVRNDANNHTAYETLLLDCMLGDATLFMRSDAVEEAWSIMDPIVNEWRHSKAPLVPNYAAGEWGPREAETIMLEDGAHWRNQ